MLNKVRILQYLGDLDCILFGTLLGQGAVNKDAPKMILTVKPDGLPSKCKTSMWMLSSVDENDLI